jgi:hypothetical protein
MQCCPVLCTVRGTVVWLSWVGDKLFSDNLSPTDDTEPVPSESAWHQIRLCQT